jgi:hypothetical protein
VTQLGSIFEPEPGEGPRGRDLRADVTVPAWACGFPPGFPVEVPLELPALGGYVRRSAPPGEAGAAVHLHLPAGFPDGGTLRLRGQGEAVDGGRPGDLLLTVSVDRSQASPPPELLARLQALLAAQPGAPAPTWPSGQLAPTLPVPPVLVLWIVLGFGVAFALVFAL